MRIGNINENLVAVAVCMYTNTMCGAGVQIDFYSKHNYSNLRSGQVLLESFDWNHCLLFDAKSVY